MKTKRIFTESPEEEQWKLLLKYTYLNNIKKYLAKINVPNPEDNLIEGISGSILQAKEYFEASKLSSLQISPLLLYYGVTNLLHGIANLTSGPINTIKDHGMFLNIPENPRRIGDIEIRPCNPTTGALSLFCNIYSNNCQLCDTGSWKVIEVFGSIPDLREDFLNCYDNAEPFVIPVEIVKKKRNTLERINPLDMARYKNVEEALSRIDGLKKNYLKPQYSIQMKYIILRPKISGEEIGIYSISGRKYMQLVHLKNGQFINPSVIILMFMALYSLGYICRYRPEIWNPFVRKDITGERLLIEKCLYFCRRLLPNLVLNFLLKERVRFIPETQGILDISGTITKQEIEEIAREEIRKTLDRERSKLR